MRLPVVPDKPDGVYRSPGADVAAPRGAIVNRMVKSSTALDRTFAALADPYRRELLHRLTSGPRTVGELAAGLPISLVAVSKHLTVLERAGLISRTRQGRHRLCRLRPAPLREASRWLAAYREFWTDRLDALAHYLTEDDTRDQA